MDIYWRVRSILLKQSKYTLNSTYTSHLYLSNSKSESVYRGRDSKNLQKVSWLVLTPRFISIFMIVFMISPIESDRSVYLLVSPSYASLNRICYVTVSSSDELIIPF